MPIETKPLDLNRIRDGYRYNPETGVITSLHWNKQVGRRSSFGYITISMSQGSRRRTIFAHRIAYILMTGENVPAGKFIDHINRNRSDNRWSNLRICTHQQNLLNSHRDRANKLPHGVYENKGSAVRPFVSRIKLNGKKKHLGSYVTAEQAEAAFNAAWKQAHEPPA